MMEPIYKFDSMEEFCRAMSNFIRGAFIWVDDQPYAPLWGLLADYYYDIGKDKEAPNAKSYFAKTHTFTFVTKETLLQLRYLLTENPNHVTTVEVLLFTLINLRLDNELYSH